MNFPTDTQVPVPAKRRALGKALQPAAGTISAPTAGATRD
jgi:hypothetical protein